MPGLKHKPRVVIVPCSGIGKTYGAVSREAAYVVTEDLRPAETQLVALSKLVLGDEAARSAVAGNPAITIDGCKLACATKMVKENGGFVAQETAVLDVYRRYKQFKPQGIAELNEGGLKLADALAKEIAAAVDSLVEEKAQVTAAPFTGAAPCTDPETCTDLAPFADSVLFTDPVPCTDSSLESGDKNG